MTTERRTRSAKELFKLEWEDSEVEGHTLEEVERELDDSWRHGNHVSIVLKETLPDGTVSFWFGQYQVSGDGEYNSWREGECEDFIEVFEKTVIIEKKTYE